MTHVDALVASSVTAATFGPMPSGGSLAEPIAIGDERPEDAGAREALLDHAFGPARYSKTCEVFRAGRLPARRLSLVARGPGVEPTGSDIVATVRLWHVDAGGVAALVLGPLAVEPRFRREGIGGRLMAEAISRAGSLGHGAILLIGDEPYYRRFGFEQRHTLPLRMPGPVEATRFLGLELTPGALSMARGLVRSTGALDLTSDRRSRGCRARLLQAA